MSRATKYLRNVVFVVMFWAAILINRDNLLIPKESNLLLFTAPLIGIVLFGLYAALNILYHLIIFRECPQAYIELQKEISMAKLDLKKKGIKI